MNFARKLRFFGVLCVPYLMASAVSAQSLDPRWKRDFPKEVSWYVRTSAGILLVKAGKSLTAVNGADGKELWVLPDVESGAGFQDLSGSYVRGRNLLEVPQMGVLLLNRVKLPGDTDGRLIALNLMTGKRLWDEPQLDDLMTAVPLYRDGQIVLVSRRMQKKVVAGEIAVSGATGVPILPYPYRFELQRMDPVTGKVQWRSEYPETFLPGVQTVAAIANQLFIYVGNRFVGSVDLVSGSRMWEESSRSLHADIVLLPLQQTDDGLVYGSNAVQEVNLATGKVRWEIDGLGRITGIATSNGLVVAIGEKNIATVDAKTGKEKWRRKTHGHTTNILWDKPTDAVIFVDGKGLHKAERTTGRSLLDAPLQTASHPYAIRLAGSEALVTISTGDVCAYDLRTGKKLFTEGKLEAYFRGEAFLDHWPMPEGGQGLVQLTKRPSETEWNGIRKGTLLPGDVVSRLQGYAPETEGGLDAYETEKEREGSKVWWIDPNTNRQISFGVSGEHHDVSRPMGMVFAVEGNELWGAAVTTK